MILRCRRDRERSRLVLFLRCWGDIGEQQRLLGVELRFLIAVLLKTGGDLLLDVVAKRLRHEVEVEEVAQREAVEQRCEGDRRQNEGGAKSVFQRWSR